MSELQGLFCLHRRGNGLSAQLYLTTKAHCISEWSHNFRPDYLRIRQALAALRVKRILALTATATKRTSDSICELLGISQDCVIKASAIRSNLNLSVSLSNGDTRYVHVIALFL